MKQETDGGSVRIRALAISDVDLMDLPRDDFIIRDVTDNYFVRILHKANEFGLEGKKITEVVTIKENCATGLTFVDFICEPVLKHTEGRAGELLARAQAAEAKLEIAENKIRALKIENEKVHKLEVELQWYKDERLDSKKDQA